ncbi:MAG: UPF0146 family protein [Methanoregula sp.]|nr:MAG: UPF0146 family protein [Methanoregula sp.]
MGEHKHIEKCVGAYIAAHYNSAVEVGIGQNTTAARIIAGANKVIRCTDIKKIVPDHDLEIIADDIFEPDTGIYAGAEVIYAIRPAIEMVPPMIALAERVNADLLVYHLGFELYGNGGDTVDCGVLLHLYHARRIP